MNIVIMNHNNKLHYRINHQCNNPNIIVSGNPSVWILFSYIVSEEFMWYESKIGRLHIDIPSVQLDSVTCLAVFIHQPNT